MHEESAVLQLFMYSAPYMSMDVPIFWVIDQHYFVCQTVPVLVIGSSYHWRLCSFYIPSLVCICVCLRERLCVSVCVVGGGRVQYFCQVIQDVSGSSYIFTIWILESAISTKNHGSFYYRTASDIRIQKVDMLVDNGVTFLLCSLPGKVRAYTCIY